VRAVRQTELALAEGAVALAEHRPDDAIAAFRRASTTMTWGSNDACRVCALPWLGRAYEEAGARDSAAAVYERYLTTGDPQRGLSDAAWRAVILDRLGMLHAQLGDTTRAVKRLSEFVELWKGADASLAPKVARARRQLADLRR
jgi:tetratricopeptide (TPR) repeat protein